MKKENYKSVIETTDGEIVLTTPNGHFLTLNVSNENDSGRGILTTLTMKQIRSLKAAIMIFEGLRQQGFDQ